LRQVANTILTEASELAKKEGAIKIQTAIGSGDPASSLLGLPNVGILTRSWLVLAVWAR